MKDEQLDRFFRSAIENMDGLPPQVRHWDKEYSFGKIQEGLNGGDSQKSRHFFDLAAAAVVSVLALAYSVSFFIGSHSNPVKNQKIEEATINIQPLALQELKPQNENNNFSIFENTSNITSEEVIASLKPYGIEMKSEQKDLDLFRQKEKGVEINADNDFNNKLIFSFNTPFSKKSDNLNVKNRSNKNLAFEMPVGMSFSGAGIAPVISAQATLNLPQTGRHQKQISAAISAYNTFQQNEASKTTIRPVLFAEGSFGVVSNPDAFVTGHAVGAGYQLNESEVYEGKAVKFNYTISVKKRLKVSAEAIVSEGFGKVQPGFKVTFI